MTAFALEATVPKPRPVRATPFTRWLRDQLARRGWTQQEFADRAGVSQPTVAKWLTGRIEPSPDSMQRIADALYVGIDDVLDAALPEHRAKPAQTSGPEDGETA